MHFVLFKSQQEDDRDVEGVKDEKRENGLVTKVLQGRGNSSLYVVE